MKKLKIILIILLCLLLVVVSFLGYIVFSRTNDPSENEELLFIERYFNIEFPQCKKIEILEKRNNRPTTIKFTVDKIMSKRFLKSVYPEKREDFFQNGYYVHTFSELQKSILLEYSQNNDSQFFGRRVNGYYIFNSYSLLGVCKKGIFYDEIVVAYSTSEDEERLIENCGEEWYLKCRVIE